MHGQTHIKCIWVHLSVVAAQPVKAFYKEVLKNLLYKTQFSH